MLAGSTERNQRAKHSYINEASSERRPLPRTDVQREDILDRGVNITAILPMPLTFVGFTTLVSVLGYNQSYEQLLKAISSSEWVE